MYNVLNIAATLEINGVKVLSVPHFKPAFTLSYTVISAGDFACTEQLN